MSASTSGLAASVRGARPPSALGSGIPLGKRTLDLAAIVLGIPLVVPLMLVIAAFIKLVSPGPLFFRQERIGLGERRFRMFKFRSMRPDADSGVHQAHTTHLYRSDLPLTKIDKHGDPRLIPLGAFLRSSGLDELPQLINVLRGEMSIVGPRPCTVYEYRELDPADRARFEAPPGITGLWQVSGKNKTTFREMIALDIAYARGWSLGLDLRIMAKTFPVLLAQVREIIGTKR
jgi:exopolysaccharide production protein ExoY